MADAARACVARLSDGQSLNTLVARGFRSSRNEYGIRVPNPNTVGSSSISVRERENTCQVRVSPAMFNETSILFDVAEDALLGAGYREEIVQINGALGRKVFVRGSARIEPRIRTGSGRAELILSRRD
ncbi:hypothetical protein AAD018_003930 [Aestuariibius insulae]|uniref:hypothetical protein n=1 Tax=Aestuariibius insulae TaxID=2058287 RepID=UPI00345E324B